MDFTQICPINSVKMRLPIGIMYNIAIMGFTKMNVDFTIKVDD